MTRSTTHRSLKVFAWITAGVTFCLLGVGGLVTSKEAGMAVPDWPTTYGYNMFLFPVHLWTGGIFYEHTHRLVASLVGFLTLILAGWLWLAESRRWLRWMGVAAFVAVVLQGILGGLRVTLYKDEIGIFHAALAQAFFVTVTLIALFVSGWRGQFSFQPAQRFPHWLRRCSFTATMLIFGQLVLGASMRHQHAGLAVPDFPLAYGKLWPPTDPDFIARVNQQRLGAQEYKAITAPQIWLHMAHRFGAVCILAMVAATCWAARRETGRGSAPARLAGVWLGLICLQALLGALTVWSNKAADVATTHVLVGALSLLAGALMSVALARRTVSVRGPVSDQDSVGPRSPKGLLLTGYSANLENSAFAE